MGAYAVEDNLEPGKGQALHIHLGCTAAVHHQSHIQHHDFAADTLFRRSAVYRHCIIPVCLRIFERRCRCQNGRPLKLVPAGMADFRKRVIFAEQADVWAAVPMMIDCPECRFHPRYTALHCKTFLFQPVCQQCERMVLIQPQLRMVENIIRHSCHLWGNRIYVPEHFLFFLQHKNTSFNLIHSVYRTLEVFV